MKRNLRKRRKPPKKEAKWRRNCLYDRLRKKRKLLKEKSIQMEKFPVEQSGSRKSTERRVMIERNPLEKSRNPQKKDIQYRGAEQRR